MTVLLLLLHNYVVVRTLNKCESRIRGESGAIFSALSNK